MSDHIDPPDPLLMYFNHPPANVRTRPDGSDLTDAEVRTMWMLFDMRFDLLVIAGCLRTIRVHVVRMLGEGRWDA